MKKKVICLLVAAAAVCILAACSANTGTQTEPEAGRQSDLSDSTVPGREETGEPNADGKIKSGDQGKTEVKEAEDKPELKKLSYSIDYHRISPFLEERYDEQTIQTAGRVIDAFLKNETEVETQEMTRFEQENIHGLLRVMCPPFVAFCDVEYKTAIGSTDTSTAFSWRYRVPREEIDEKLEAFEAAIDGYMADVFEDDTEAMKALCIYYAYSKAMSYDYQSAEDEAGGLSKDEAAYRTSSFCALTDHTGVCYSISEGLMFLFNMVGINAGTVGSYEGEGAHEWTIAEIEDHYYYFDATWDINESESDSLVYFGITEEDRAGWAGGYPAESVEFECIEEIYGKYDLSDTRFEPINGEKARNVYSFEADHIEQTVRITADTGVLCADMK